MNENRIQPPTETPKRGEGNPVTIAGRHITFSVPYSPSESEFWYWTWDPERNGYRCGSIFRTLKEMQDFGSSDCNPNASGPEARG